MDSGLWPQSSAFSPADVALVPCPATGILSEQLCNGITEKKAFPSTHLQSLSVSPLPIKTWVFVSLAPDLQTNIKWLDLFQKKQNETKQNEGSIQIAGPNLPPGGTQNERQQILSQEQRRKVKNIWTTESITNAAECSPVHSTVGEEWLHCEKQDSALTFPEIPWRGLLRLIQVGQRHRPEEICDSGDSNFQELVE